MKTLILAAMLGMATLVPTAVPTQAASLTITTDDGQGRYDDNYYWRHHHMRDRDRDNWRSRHHHRNRDCYVKVIKHWRHHHRVIEKIRVCERRDDW